MMPAFLVGVVTGGLVGWALWEVLAFYRAGVRDG